MLGRRTAVVVATALAIVAVVALLVLAAEVLLLVFARLSFAVLLSSLADALVGISGMGRRMALGLTVLVLPAGPAATAWALWPSVSELADQPATELPAALRELRDWFEQRAWGRWLLGRAEPDQMADGEAIVNQATGRNRHPVGRTVCRCSTRYSLLSRPLFSQCRRTPTIMFQLVLGILVGAIGVAVATPSDGCSNADDNPGHSFRRPPCQSVLLTPFRTTSSLV